MYKLASWITLFLMLNLSLGSAIPRDNKRVMDRVLSDELHFDDGDHNRNYDHEAFLGEDEARAFDQLKPEESKRRLAVIISKIDSNGDNFVTFDELKDWIHKSSKNYILEDSDRQWTSHNPDNKSAISWEDYKRVTYGFMDHLNNENSDKNEDHKTYKDMMRRDHRRWLLADVNQDSLLDKSEFTDFLHPEETSHMKHVVIDETLEDIDRDNDGRISLSEYISDMYSPEHSKAESEPSWVTHEKDQFKNYRDKNGDGFMDKDEIKEWIIPPDYDHSESEAKHLLRESDSDKATDFGEALMMHDEF